MTSAMTLIDQIWLDSGPDGAVNGRQIRFLARESGGWERTELNSARFCVIII